MLYYICWLLALAENALAYWIKKVCWHWSKEEGRKEIKIEAEVYVKASTAFGQKPFCQLTFVQQIFGQTDHWLTTGFR